MKIKYDTTTIKADCSNQLELGIPFGLNGVTFSLNMNAITLIGMHSGDRICQVRKSLTSESKHQSNERQQDTLRQSYIVVIIRYLEQQSTAIVFCLCPEGQNICY